VASTQDNGRHAQPLAFIYVDILMHTYMHTINCQEHHYVYKTCSDYWQTLILACVCTSTHL